MRTNRFLKMSFAACLAAMFLTVAAEAQPGGGQRGQGGRGSGGQRGGGGQGGQRGGGRGGVGGLGGGSITISKAPLIRSEDVLDELQSELTALSKL